MENKLVKHVFNHFTPKQSERQRGTESKRIWGERTIEEPDSDKEDMMIDVAFNFLDIVVEKKARIQKKMLIYK